MEFPSTKKIRVLLASPPAINENFISSDIFAGAQAKIKVLPDLLAKIAAEADCEYFDAQAITSSSDRDGVHLEPEAHKTLGIAFANAIINPKSAQR